MTEECDEYRWDIGHILRANTDFPEQEEIIKDNLFNAEGGFNTEYAGQMLQKFMHNLDGDEQTAIANISGAIRLISRLELYATTLYFEDYEEQYKDFFEQTNDFCAGYRNKLESYIINLKNKNPDFDYYSPSLDYTPGFYNLYANRSEQIIASFGSFVSGRVIKSSFLDGETSLAELWGKLLLETDTVARRKIWDERAKEITSDEFRAQFMASLAEAKELEKTKRHNMLNPNPQTSETAGFSQEHEDRWLEAVSIATSPDGNTYTGLFHEYIALKSKHLGTTGSIHPADDHLSAGVGRQHKKMHACDMRADIFKADDNGCTVTLDDCREMGEEIFACLGDNVADFVKRYFSKSGFIDLGKRDTKSPYGYCLQSAVGESFISAWFYGKSYNLTTAIHEAAHAINYWFCSKKPIPEEPPLIRDEFVTGVFELIATQKIIENAKSSKPEHYAACISESLNGIFTGICTSASFHEMEKYIHNSPEMLSEAEMEKKWIELTKKTFGKSFNAESYIPAMYEDEYFMDPLYSHIYSKTMCMAFAVVEQYNKAKDKAEFGRKMIQFMQEPNSKPLTESIRDVFGIDVDKSWTIGVEWVSAQLSELKRISKRIAPDSLHEKKSRQIT